MKIAPTEFLKKHPHLIACCVVFFCLTLTIGTGTALAQDRSGPALGETIDLTSLQSQKGRSLAEAMKGHSLAMLVLVNPDCVKCNQAKDSLRALQSRVEKAGIAYYVVMIMDGSDAQKYFAYANSLNPDVEAFVWSNTEAKPPVSLATMVTPSQILLSNEGIVVEKWAGTLQLASTRERMVNQIASVAVKHLRSIN
jgi:hypothetical protein